MINTMQKKDFYETPSLKEVESDLNAVLCTSEREGEVQDLVDKYNWSWSDMSNNS